MVVFAVNTSDYRLLAQQDVWRCFNLCLKRTFLSLFIYVFSDLGWSFPQHRSHSHLKRPVVVWMKRDSFKLVTDCWNKKLRLNPALCLRAEVLLGRSSPEWWIRVCTGRDAELWAGSRRSCVLKWFLFLFFMFPQQRGISWLSLQTFVMKVRAPPLRCSSSSWFPVCVWEEERSPPCHFPMMFRCHVEHNSESLLCVHTGCDVSLCHRTSGP